MAHHSPDWLAGYLSSEFITGPLLGELHSTGIFCWVFQRVLNLILDISQGVFLNSPTWGWRVVLQEKWGFLSNFAIASFI